MVALTLTIGSAVVVSTQLHPAPWVHDLALLAHLIALMIGVGSVLAVDWYGLLWLLRRVSTQQLMLQAHLMSPLIWLGLVALTGTGALLEPQLTSPTTVVKLSCVVGVAVVGVLALATKRQMLQYRALPRSLMLRGMALAGASQVFWWSAFAIGFVNAQTP